jgi:putative phosphotransacetylase
MVGPAGEIEIAEGCIIAKRHIHFDTATANEMGISDKQIVKVKIDSDRTTIFDDVVCRVSDAYAFAMHIDTDECNAACAFGEVYGEILL